MNSPFNMMQMFQNPQQFIQNAMKNSQVMQNPIISNAMGLFQKGDYKGLNELAENMCKENGTTMENMKNQLMKQFNL